VAENKKNSSKGTPKEELYETTTYPLKDLKELIGRHVWRKAERFDPVYLSFPFFRIPSIQLNRHL